MQASVATVDGPAATAGERPSSRPGARERVVAWGLGLVAALVVVGPGLRPGSWLNLDMVVTPITPVPRGVWGLGPELPRRVPYALPLAWLSSVVDSTWVVKAMVVVSIAAAVAGAWNLAARWFDDLPWFSRAGAGLLYGLSPFLLTRLGVGHIPLVMAMGILPWAVPSLFEPCVRPDRMFLWSAALGACGFLGGMLPLLIVPLGIACTRAATRRVLVPFSLVLLAQLPWILPGGIVLSQGASPANSSDFRTSTYGDGGLVRVLAGHGFWRGPDQIGSGLGWEVPILGVLLVVLAVYGGLRLGRFVRWPALAVAVVGLGIPLASALPGLRRLYAFLVDSPVSAILREGQRILPLYLVVLAPAVVGGAVRLAHRWPGWRADIVLALPLAVAVFLAAPGLWGVSGDLSPVHIPPAWSTVRTDVHRGGGTTLSLPFFEYAPIAIAGQRVTLDPMPIYLGGDVLSSSNPELNTQSEERADPREKGVARLVREMRADHPVSAQLAAAGIHWVVLRHDRDWMTYRSLDSDPGFRHVVTSSTIDLFEVRAWAGEAVAANGAPVQVHDLVAPVADLSTKQAVRWNRPGAPGWVRGGTLARTTANGVLEIPAGSGPVWYWPAVVVLLGDAVVLFAIGVALARLRHLRKSAGTS
jgi:hypothetical protein